MPPGRSGSLVTLLWGPGHILVFSGTVLLMSACGSPIAPASRGVAGAWLANATLAAASGGDCIGSALQNEIGSRDVFTAALKQDGSRLEATVASEGNGTLCAYTGTVASQAVSLTLASCQNARVRAAPCRTSELRDLQLVGGSITANVDTALGTGAGRDISSWDVFPAGGQTRLGTLTITADFTWRFLGLPASDYHVFTGTVFPGYADGTISIPDDPNPFCTRCGWFFR